MLINFAVAGMFAGLAGGLLGPFNRSIAPDLCNWHQSGIPVFMTIIGGTASFFGPLIGSVIYTFLFAFVTGFTEYWPLTIGVVIIFVVGLTYLFYTMKLITEVRDDDLCVQFFPLSRQVISFDSVTSCEVRTYNPIKEYGGWGIRYGKRGKAYNVSRNRGVQIEFHAGKPLLIGSKKPEELERAINMRI